LSPFGPGVTWVVRVDRGGRGGKTGGVIPNDIMNVRGNNDFQFSIVWNQIGSHDDVVVNTGRITEGRGLFLRPSCSNLAVIIVDPNVDSSLLRVTDDDLLLAVAIKVGNGEASNLITSRGRSGPACFEISLSVVYGDEASSMSSDHLSVAVPVNVFNDDAWPSPADVTDSSPFGSRMTRADGPLGSSGRVEHDLDEKRMEEEIR